MAKLEKNNTPGPHAHDWAAGYLQVRREVLARIINAFALLTPPVLLVGVVKLLPQQRWWIIAIYLVLFVLTLLAAAIKKRVPFEHMAVSVLCALYLFGIMLLAAFGTSGAGIEFLLAFALLAAILLGRKAGLVAAVLSMLGIAAIGAALANGWIPISLETMTNSTTGLTWAVAVCLFTLLAAVLIFAQNTLITNLQRSLTQLGLQTRDLEETNMMLRLEVMERRRTQEELEKANILLQAESAERRQAYQALESSEVFNSAVVDNSPLGISVRAPDGTLLQYNAAWQRIWAMSEDRIQDDMTRSRHSLRFDDRDDYLGEWQPRVREIYHHGGTLHVPPVRTGGKRAGMAEWVEHHFYGIRDAQGEVKNVVVLTADVSEQMQAAEALTRSESLYRFLAERSSDVMWKADLNLKFTFVSSAVERLFGYSVEEALTHSVDDVVTTDSLNKILSTLQDCFADPSHRVRPCVVEGQMRRRDGELVWVDITIVVIRNQAGEPVEIQGTTRDISARKEVEEQLRVSEQQYRLVVENAADVVVVTDLDLHPLFISPSVETVAGYTVGEAMALPLDQILDRQSFDLAMAVQESELAHAATARPATNRVELRMAHKDGRPLLLEANSRFLRQTDGTVFGLISVLRDITKRREAEDALRESEQRYRMVVDNIVDVVVVADLEMTPLYVSPSIEHVLGYTVDEAMVLGAKGILTVDSLQYVLQTVGELLALGPHAPARTIWTEVRARRKFGSTVLCESHSRFLRHSDGTPYGIITLLRDANERREMDEKLRESEQRYRLVVENVVDIVMVTDLNLQPTFVSPSVSVLLGYSPEELLALPLDRLLTTSSLRQVQALNQTEMAIAMIEKPTTTRSEVECYHKNGTIVQFETHSRYLRRADGRPYALISVWRDLTERRKAEQAVRESEAKYRLLADNMADTIWIMDMDLHLTYVSPAVMRLRGYTVEEALSQSVKDRLTPESLARVTQLLVAELPKELAGQGTPGATWTLELETSRKDGTTVWTEQVIKFLRNSEGIAVGILGVSRDITERRQAAEALRESESKYRLLAENAADLIWTTDITFRFTYVSPSVERVLGYTVEETSRRPVVELLTPPSQREAAAALADEMEHAVVRTSPPYGSRTLELEMVRRDGTTIWTENTLSFLRNERHEPAGVLGVTRDISDRKRAEKERRELEDQLNQAQKMEAVGRLAGGVAHDFNNILTGITGYTEMLLASLRPADPLIDDIEEIRKSAGRASALTAQLLAFSRKQTIEPRVLDLNALIQHSSRMLRRLIGEDVELQFLPGSDLGRVRTDPVQVEQILVNLAVNARDAMPNGGRLSICTANIEVDAAFCQSRPDAQPGEYVVLTVEDNGCGMSPEVQQHLFEPFFTTKPKGKGTGLGLSTIYGIVQQNRGFLTVRSEVGNGTSWRVYLPREHADIDQPSPEPVTAPPRGSETILMVEDEEMLRNLVRRILERQGYQVLSASGGQEAVAEAKRHPARIDLLLTDVIMPDANGKQVYEQLRLQRPDIKVLFMSGYTGDAIAQHGLFDLDLPFIQKPFTIRNLAARVREILDS